MNKKLEVVVKKSQDIIRALEKDLPAATASTETGDEDLNNLVVAALTDRIKTEVDKISRQLIQLRMQQATGDRQNRIREIARQSLLLRRLSWRAAFKNLARRKISS